MNDTTIPARDIRMHFLWLVCLVAAMGGFLFGYDWVVIGGAKAFYEPYFQIAEGSYWQSLGMSTALFGCIPGALLAGALSDRFGRKRLLILSGALFTLSAVWTALAGDFLNFNIARFVGGIGIGLASNLSPMYIAEMSPAKLRGRFVSINQLTIVLGILAAQWINWRIADPIPTANQLRLLVSTDAQVRDAYGPGYDIATEREEANAITDRSALARVQAELPDLAVAARSESEAERAAKREFDQKIMATYLVPTWNCQRAWRWMFGAETVPALLFFLLMFSMPESPRWLIKYGRDEEADRILRKVGGIDFARAEVADVKSTLSREDIAQVRYRDLLESKLFRIVCLGVFLAVFQQWCGINVIFNYAQNIFTAAGYALNDLMFSILITGIVNLVFTFVAIFTVDRLGRRPLMLIGAAGLAGIYAVLGTSYYLQTSGIYMLVLVISAIACYSMSLAPITWVVISELFPNRIRGAAMSIAVFALWVGCTALTFTFPILNRELGTHAVFWLYGAICVVGFLVILTKLPETKEKSLEDIERELVD